MLLGFMVEREAAGQAKHGPPLMLHEDAHDTMTMGSLPEIACVPAHPHALRDLLDPETAVQIESERNQRAPRTPCSVCGKRYVKTCFAKKADWLAPDQPLCQACRDREHGRDIADRFSITKTVEELQKLSPGQEAAFVRGKRLELIAALTKKKLQGASIKEATQGAKELFTIERLLQEKPTQIIDHGTREDLLAMARAVKEERARRTTILDVTPTAVPA